MTFFRQRILRTISDHFLLLLLSLLALITSCSQDVSLSPLADDATILAFGDSLTYGSGARPEESYPSVLADQTGLTVINAGIPGEISAAGLRRLPALLDRHQPELLILCHGANDILRRLSRDTMRDNLKQMIELARSRDIEVVLIAVPEFSFFLSDATVYRQLADDTGTPLLEDVMANIISTPSLRADQVHPNQQGYKILANAVYELLRNTGAVH